ncbi:hypothetical protein FB451DRAFT_307946 [Mycena latifolia]|nr:hypothetical protein FB451DRAFT_307946 [Mycena latifolia]
MRLWILSQPRRGESRSYFTSLVSAILVLYSPEDVESSFFAQLLNVYSIIVAAIIAIAKHNLDKMHSVIALSLAASPLSLYLLMYVVRSMAGNQNRLQGVFGKGKILNRIVVILMLPLWAGVLSFTALPTSVWHFQQAACDRAVADNSIVKLFFIPFILFVTIIPEVGATILAIFFLTWGTAIFRMRKIIWKKGNKILPFGRMWRKIVTQYPFIQFCTVIILPHFIWVFNIEFGLALLSNGESFTATYGQLLAIFVTVPPFIQLCLLLPRVPRWFADLTWVRLMTCRRNAPKKRDNESELPLQDGLTRLTQKPGPDRLPTGETFKLDDYSYVFTDEPSN